MTRPGYYKEVIRPKSEGVLYRTSAADCSPPKLKTIEKKCEYIIIPGSVRSSDGDHHTLSSHELARLYGIPLYKCLVVHEGDYRTLDRHPDLKILRPRTDGRYKESLLLEESFGNLGD